MQTDDDAPAKVLISAISTWRGTGPGSDISGVGYGKWASRGADLRPADGA